MHDRAKMMKVRVVRATDEGHTQLQSQSGGSLVPRLSLNIRNNRESGYETKAEVHAANVIPIE